MVGDEGEKWKKQCRSKAFRKRWEENSQGVVSVKLNNVIRRSY